MIEVWIWIYHAKIMLQHVALYFISSTANVREASWPHTLSNRCFPRPAVMYLN